MKLCISGNHFILPSYSLIWKIPQNLVLVLFLLEHFFKYMAILVYSHFLFKSKALNRVQCLWYLVLTGAGDNEADEVTGER